MRLIVEREASVDGATIGQMTVEGEIGRLAWTLEDQVREVPGAPVATWKVPTVTAIPAGEYRIAATFSPKFKRRTPILLGVPGFSEIRIHSGNTDADTDGCLLVGLTREKNMIYQSRAALERVYARVESALLAAEEVRLVIS